MHTRIPLARATLFRAALALVCALATSVSLAGAPIKTGGTGFVSIAPSAASGNERHAQ